MDAHLAEVLVDRLSDRLHLSVGPASADHEVVGEGGQTLNVEYDEVVGLLLQGEADAEQRGFARFRRVQR